MAGSRTPAVGVEVHGRRFVATGGHGCGSRMRRGTWRIRHVGSRSGIGTASISLTYKPSFGLVATRKEQEEQ
jgi:hypothetical protein